MRFSKLLFAVATAIPRPTCQKTKLRYVTVYWWTPHTHKHGKTHTHKHTNLSFQVHHINNNKLNKQSKRSLQGRKKS